MAPVDIKNFCLTLSIKNINPKTELFFISSFTLLVAVVLSAQSTDKSVNKITKNLFKFYSTPEDLILLGEDGLKNCIKSIGLYNTKAKNLIRLSKKIIELYGSKVPSFKKDLESLPGVGRKSANVVLNVIFNKPTIAVDTHVHRVANRVNLSSDATPYKVEKKLINVIPDLFVDYIHNLMVLHGRYVCTARSPKCSKCLINTICHTYRG
jgi:endonuclease III